MQLHNRTSAWEPSTHRASPALLLASHSLEQFTDWGTRALTAMVCYRWMAHEKTHRVYRAKRWGLRASILFWVPPCTATCSPEALLVLEDLIQVYYAIMIEEVHSPWWFNPSPASFSLRGGSPNPLFLTILLPWHQAPVSPVSLEPDGSSHRVRINSWKSQKQLVKNGKRYSCHQGFKGLGDLWDRNREKCI